MPVAAPRTAAEPFRMFSTRVVAVHRPSPSFTRLTFAGPDLHRMADNGLDQRIKLILPLPGRGLDPLPTGADWYARWRALPEELRNPVRTYTVAALRQDRGEVDVDMVLHGDHGGVPPGPAGRFAARATPGDEAVILGPDARYPGRHGGLEFRPPSDGPVLVVGDETALPAIANIAASLPPAARGHVVVEVPQPEDRRPLAAPTGVRVGWVVRDGAPHGARLLDLVRSLDLPAGARTPPAHDPAGESADEELLWDVPEEPHPVSAGTFAWVAGEAAMVREVRRHLVRERAMDRRSVAFMGYWRLGRPEC